MAHVVDVRFQDEVRSPHRLKAIWLLPTSRHSGHSVYSAMFRLACALLHVCTVCSLGVSTPLNVRAVSRASPAVAMTATQKRPWREVLGAVAVCAGALAPVGVPGGAPVEGGGGSFIQRLVGARPAVAAPSLARGVNSKRLKLALKAKLAKVPVFLVTNEGGSPFLSTLAGGDQSALLFMFPSDAQRMLAGVMKAPNAASSGAKVLPSNLDRAFKLAQLPPTISGLRYQARSCRALARPAPPAVAPASEEHFPRFLFYLPSGACGSTVSF